MSSEEQILSKDKYANIRPRQIEFTVSNINFTITAELLVHSLANFHCQYADRHTNL